jgi:beta-galactosidase
VIARKDGEEIATQTLRTAGAPARIAVEADQTTLDPASRDLSYITVRVEDEDGNFAPKAARWISVRLNGPARIVGIGNGDPLSHHDFQGRTVRTFNGLARVIIAATSEEDKVRPNDKRELNEILVRIGSNGLAGGEVRLNRASE